jgi:Zn finger protein HypA/HybF involved in hydrogenase expression
MEKIIKDYILKHGDKYDYSQSDFTKFKIKIKCPNHGVFEQNKYSHKNYGCWNCAVEERSNSQKMGKEEFVEKSKNTHGDKYEYEFVDYKNNREKVTIFCREHGKFKQTPSSHLTGSGCPKCGSESASKIQSSTTEAFIEKSKKIHADKYDYSLVEYLTIKHIQTIYYCHLKTLYYCNLKMAFHSI